MKKITRICALTLIFGATLLTSCVSEEISPEIEQMRQAQVSYLQAKASMEQANADAAAVHTALLQLELEYRQAIQASEVEGAIAEIEAQVFEARKKAAAAQLALQEAIDNLTDHINDMAKEYLIAYKAATGEADAKLNEIISQEGKIARFKAFLDEHGNPLNNDLLIEEMQRNLDQDNARYKAQETSLAILESVDADPTDAEAQLADVTTRLTQLHQDQGKMQLKRDQASTEYSEAYSRFDQAQNLIDDFESLEKTIESTKDGVVNSEEIIANLAEEITSLTNQLSPFIEELEGRAAEFNPALEDAEILLERWTQAEAVFNAAAVNNVPGDEAYDTAEEARNNARTAFEDYAGDYLNLYGGSSPSHINLNNPGISGTTYGDIKIAHDAIAEEFYSGTPGAQLAEMNSKKMDLEDYSTNLEDQQSYLSQLELQWNLIHADYEEAVTNLEKHEENFSEAYAIYFTVNRELSTMSEEYIYLDRLESNLQNYLSGYIANLKAEIEYLEDQMLITKRDIADNQAALEDNRISQEEWNKRIVGEESKLESLNEEYESLLAITAKYLQQFNEVILN